MDLEKLAEEKIAGKARQGRRSRATAVIPVCCARSVNSEIVHGIPSPKRKLREGGHRLDRLRDGSGRVLRGFGGRPSPSGRIQARDAEVAGRDPRNRSTARLTRCARATASAMSATRCKVGSSSTDIRWCGVRRARHRHKDARRAQSAELRRRRSRCAAARGHGHRRRADGERGPAGSADAVTSGWRKQRMAAASAHFEHTRGDHRGRPWILTRPKEMTGPSW